VDERYRPPESELSNEGGDPSKVARWIPLRVLVGFFAGRWIVIAVRGWTTPLSTGTSEDLANGAAAAIGSFLILTCIERPFWLRVVGAAPLLALLVAYSTGLAVGGFRASTWDAAFVLGSCASAIAVAFRTQITRAALTLIRQRRLR